MNKKDLYQHGRDKGYEIARCNWAEFLNSEDFTDSDLEKFSDECHEAESNSRQYSPFEFLAHDINECKNADSLWESYDEGITAGIQKFIKEFKRENKKGYN